MIAEKLPPPPATDAADRDWEAIAASPDFQALVKARWKFAIPATLFFLAYYFALPILSGYAPDLMKTPVIGPVNIANLFALSQFAMVAVVMTLYVRATKDYDAKADAIVAKLGGKRR